MATSVSANRKRASQHLAISVYIINRTFAVLTREISSSKLEDKIRIDKQACNILHISSDSTLRAQPPVVFFLIEEEKWRLCLNRVNPLK